MDPAFVKQMALATIPPGLAGLFVLLAWSWREGRADGAGWRGHRAWWAAGSALLGLVFVPISALVVGRLSLTPASASQWIPWFGVLAGGAAFVSVRWSGSRLAVWAARSVVLALIGWLSIQGQARGGWGVVQTAETLGGFVVLSLVVLAAFDELTVDRVANHALDPAPSRTNGEVASRAALVPSLVGMILLGGIAQVLVLGFFTLVLAQVTGVAAALMGGLFVGSLWKRRVRVGRGMLDAPIVLGLVLLLQGYVFGEAERPWLFLGLIGASAVLAAIAARVMPPQWRAGKRAVIEVAAVLVPVAIAVGLALAQRPQD